MTAMNLRNIAVPFIALPGLLFALCGAHAQTYDLALDWSTSQNPNGPWSVLRGNTLLPYQTTTCCGLPQTTSFAPSSVPGSFLPVFYRPGSAGTDIYFHSYDSFNGGVYLGEATVAWTAPSTGTLDLSGYFYYAQNPDARGNLVTVKLGNQVLTTSTVSYWEHASKTAKWEFSFNDLAVIAGETLTITSQRIAGIAAGSSIAGDIRVSMVPEPATLPSICLGSILVLLTVRNRKRCIASADSGV